MTATAVPLDTLAQRIAQQQSELESLRQEYEARQARLTDLNRRKAELKTQLGQIDAEIQAVGRGQTDLSSREIPSSRPAASTRNGKPARRQKLADVLVEMVRQAKGPLTARQMAENVIAKKFPTSSQDVPSLVKTRVHELVAKGIFQRANDQPGVVLAGSRRDQSFQPANGTISKMKSKKSVVSRKITPQVERNGRKKVSLRLLLTNLLAKSQRSLAARELAEQAQAQGYSTKSTDFVNVVRLMLAMMDNVEHTPGKGYRLKKR
jgi:hypothetical protein